MPRAPKGAELVASVIMTTAQPLTITEISTLAGTSRSVTSRAMKTLHEDGAIVRAGEADTGAMRYKPAPGRARATAANAVAYVEVLEGSIGIGMCFRITQIQYAPATSQVYVDLDNGAGVKITAKLNA